MQANLAITMKKYLLLLLLAVFTLSCSKKVEVEGRVSGGSPLERMEFIDASGVATLPLVNLGSDKNGVFKGSFEAPKNGMYMMTYGGSKYMVYLKGGQKLQFNTTAMGFGDNIKFQGDVQKNNDFLKLVDKKIGEYGATLDMQKIMMLDEAPFLKEAQKVNEKLVSIVEENAKKSGADSDVVRYKKDEATAGVLGILSQYSQNHHLMVQNPNFKVSQKFLDYEKELTKDNDRLVKEMPLYRNYLLNKLSSDYSKFAQGNTKKEEESTNSELFSKFLDTRKDLSQVTKDYLLAFVMSQFDINPSIKEKAKLELKNLVKDKIKDQTVKKDMDRVLFAIAGPDNGKKLEGKLITQDGKSFSIDEVKGKPTTVLFYASFNPYVAQTTVPALKEIVNFYKSKMNFVFINLDDTKDQFVKSSNAMFKGFTAKNVYAEGGINSSFAKDWGIYAFKMPGFIVLDKDGKSNSRYFFNIADPEFIPELDKVTGLKAPTTNEVEANLQNDLVAPQPQNAK